MARGSPLQVVSNNGIIGTWSPAFDAFNTTTYTFNPDDGQCASTAEMTIVIIPSTIPEFTQVDDTCEGTELTLPTTSNNGITGFGVHNLIQIQPLIILSLMMDNVL